MNRSPRVAKRLLSLILPERIRDAVLGDLEQEYAERAVPSVGTSAAGRWYWLQALRAIPYALRFRRIEPDVRPLKGDNLMGSLIEDIRYALRGMRKSPGFTTIALVTLALGIGANTAVFSVVQAVLLRPLPYEEPERLVVIWGNLVNRDQPKFPVSPFDLRDYREQATLFEGFTGVRTFQRTLVGGGAQPEQIQVADVTPNFSSLLGVLPILGRAFEDSDAVPIGSGGDPATLLNPVLLDHSLWQRRFGSDPTVIGQTVEIAGNTVEIVGVMPPGTQLLLGPNSGVATEVDAWMTPRINLETWGGRRQVTWRVIARLKPGVTVGQAQAEMDGIANRIRQEESVFETAGYRLDVFPMIENLTADIRPAVMALLGAVGFVLLIACANVGNLMLVRASNREREIAIRAALGGRRRRLLRQLLVESTVLGLTGGALGLLLAYGGMELLLALKPANLPRVEAVAVDGNVLGFTLLASLAAAIIFGTIPAMQASKPRLVESLKDGGRIAALSSQRIFRNGLIVTEIALSVVLLVGAGLMVRSFIALERVDPGYDPVNVLTFEVSTQGGRYNQAGRIEFNRLFRERAAGIPGVTSVSAAFPLPLQGNPFTGRYGPTEALTDETLFGQADYRILEPGYFETMKTRLLAGRVFDQSDFTDSAEVTVIDETLARILWPGVSAVGQRLVIRPGGDPTEVEVIGVVEHQRSDALASEGRETVYLTNRYFGPTNTISWIVRTSGDPSLIVPEVRKALAEIDPQIPAAGITTMEARVSDAMAGTRFALALIGVFGIIALAMASVGIYGVLSSVVRQRTAEIGVRIAFGAETGTILWLVAKRGLALTIVGLTGGLVGGLWATRFLETLLVGVEPTDPVSFAGIAAIFMMVALIACYVPARRATRLDPAVALREE